MLSRCILCPVLETLADTKKATHVAFGLFEADLRAGELHRAGSRVRLQALPFRVLTVLLEKPGEVVTREELQMRVWGPNVVVDFEHSLANAVKKLREALGDSADNPRVIETLSRRGFRFIAPVTVADRLTEQVPPALSKAVISIPEPQPVQESSQAIPVAAAPLRRLKVPTGWLVVLAFAAGALLAGYGLQIWHTQRQSTLSPRMSQITREGTIYTPKNNLIGLIPGFVSDGSQIFSSAQEAGEVALKQISLTGGASRTVSLLSQIRSPQVEDISADGTKLLVRSNIASSTPQPLWVVPTDGSSAFRIGNVLALDAVWMPDGKSILYSSDNQFLVVSADDGRSAPFAGVAGRAFWPRWSPDGKQLRFTIVDAVNHTSTLWELSASSRNAKPILKLSDASVRQCCGVWTADGRTFVYERSQDGVSDLWKTNASLSERPIRVTNGPLNYRAPVPGRKGSQIFFVGQDFRSMLERYDPDRKEYVSQPGFLASADHIRFSSDGAWVSWVDPDQSLWRARANGSEKMLLTPPSMHVYMSNWSPDSTRIAFMAREQQKPWQIYMVNADGGPPVQLLVETKNIGDPFFSADGKSIVFGSVGEFVGDPKTRALYFLDLVTRRVTQVPDSLGLFSPAWSPDGRFIAAITTDQSEVVLYDTRTSTWRRLAHTSAAWPIWSKDSGSLFVHAYQANDAPILRIAVATSKVETVADLKGFRVGPLARATFAGLTPSNVPLMHVEATSGDLYSLSLDQK